MESVSIVLSFIGKMPEYVIECITQIRTVSDSDIYLIYNDIDDRLYEKIKEKNVICVHYDKVVSNRFNSKFKPSDFVAVDGLKDRRLLFMRSYERFYILDELIKLYNLQYIWFMEIDNLLYVNPNKLLPTLKNKPYVYSYHREGHFNTGIFFVKNSESLQPILESFDNFKGSFRSEMIALHSHYQINKSDCLFPLIIPTPNENRLFWKDYSEFDNHLFDGAILGIYYFGLDTYHTQGKLVTKSPDVYSIKDKFLNFWKYGAMTWKKEGELFFPYFITNEKTEHPIVNLHIHSKDLKSAASYSDKF